MKVQCVICDQVEEIHPDSLLGKKLRNHPLVTYMCLPCKERITENTEKRRADGLLPDTSLQVQEEEW
ncbi:YlaI family protein [Bacillus horti]|uniref:Uncharacterized protein YlaI n=1 Tax=Caldalkalibacillus horti TaxID=77523 RepID=A0ABT9W0X2_9BACI|nr:YlaI family protein [Bacillus horti]MDQ0166926.1 uncharacterized protein YlaI [Bacillus horti]